MIMAVHDTRSCSFMLSKIHLPIVTFPHLAYMSTSELAMNVL
uniref:Uncharacterized protein n=1 Tax=Rhizophora mucronata TaxID=61149 RepID=A0A2P2PR09_RHIMU